MSPRLGTYTFLPWLRQGLANQIVAGGVPPGSSRTTIEVVLRLQATSANVSLTETITRPVPLYGPGDVIGIDRRAVVKTDPCDRTTNFEANYLPHIEFYDEDFPWRYTPEPVAGHRLRPWIALVVLKEDEFEDHGHGGDRPLPCISVDMPETLFPPFEQLWAWAHVQVNGDLAATEAEVVSGDMTAVLPKLESLLRMSPDVAYSRLLSPRRLDVSTTYHAFVVPAFEAGRRAGLGHDPAGAAADLGAWGAGGAGPEANFFPYYHRWTFITAATGDFEYLVRLLEPRPVDSRVGYRDIDVQEPGSNLRGVTDPRRGGVLRLGGALRVPLSTLDADERNEYELYEGWDRPGYPQPFQQDLAAFINLADDYAGLPAAAANSATGYQATMPDPDNPGGTQTDPDPLITPPLYGRWHALTSRLLTESEGTAEPHDANWMHQLNLDPRHRIAANYGTEVMQRHQENFMEAAWEQVGDVLAANSRIRLGQFSMLAAHTWYTRTLLPLAANPAHREHALWLTAPVQARVVSDGLTVRQQVGDSTVPRALLTSQARRILRPGGRLLRTLQFDERRTPSNLIERVNDGQVTANPPKPPLEGAPTLDDVADAADAEARASIPPIARTLLVHLSWLIIALVAALVALALWAPPAGGLLLPVAIFLFWLIFRLRRWRDGMRGPSGLREESRRPDAVDRLPQSPDFRLIASLDDLFRPSTNGSDSAEAVRYKTALREAYTLVDASRRASTRLRPVRARLDLERTVETLVAAVAPRLTIPRHVRGGLAIPPRVREQLGEGFVEVMAYPEIDLPMYRPLVEAAEENFLPSMRFIGQNTISLLETNQAFIEAYMVGLNHESVREQLWRGFPTDQRGTCFRQFWDASGYLDDSGADADALRERLRDIPPLHRWRRDSKLGDHDHRERGGAAEEEVVLVIRGELLKRYPNAAIYAHRARWQMRGGAIARDLPRELDERGVGEDANPSRNRVRTPLYQAKVEPDITFLGFDLTIDEALGDPESADPARAGWFFVLKERPGEPRFGLDITAAESVRVWSDLGWGNVAPGIRPGEMLQITAATPTITLAPLPAATEPATRDQAQDDAAVHWHRDMNADELAYILYQVPVMVAVHAAEMLPRTEVR
jgi:hypothetical protein